jgi:hypothetical protein
MESFIMPQIHRYATLRRRAARCRHAAGPRRHAAAGCRRCTADADDSLLLPTTGAFHELYKCDDAFTAVIEFDQHVPLRAPVSSLLAVAMTAVSIAPVVLVTTDPRQAVAPRRPTAAVCRAHRAEYGAARAGRYDELALTMNCHRYSRIMETLLSWAWRRESR